MESTEKRNMESMENNSREETHLCQRDDSAIKLMDELKHILFKTGKMESRKWYERRKPLRFRVWDGNAFAYECRLAINEKVAQVIGDDGVPRENVQLQEWTGCLDNEKHEIYEGDFLMLLDEGGWIGAVVFGDGEFWCRDEKGNYSSMVTFEDGMVVGNVFQGIDMSLVELEVRRRTSEDKKVDEIMAGYARDYEMTCTNTTFDVR